MRLEDLTQHELSLMCEAIMEYFVNTGVKKKVDMPGQKTISTCAVPIWLHSFDTQQIELWDKMIALNLVNVWPWGYVKYVENAAFKPGELSLYVEKSVKKYGNIKDSLRGKHVQAVITDLGRMVFAHLIL